MTGAHDFLTVSDGVYQLEVPDAGIVLHVDRLRRRSDGELVGELTVRCDLAGAHPVHQVGSLARELARMIKQTGKEQGVGLSVHAPYFFNLNATEEEWPKSRKRLMDAAHYGNLAGATDIIFHPGSYFEQPPADVLKVAIPRLKSCADELRKAKNPVNLRPETMGKSAMLGSLEDTLAINENEDDKHQVDNNNYKAGRGTTVIATTADRVSAGWRRKERNPSPSR